MANVNNYINAARAVAQDSAQIFGTIRDSSPGYDEIAKANISETAKTKATYAINEAAAARARINAETEIDLVKRKAKTDKDIRGINKQARMTGMLAGGAAMLGIGAMQLNKKDEVDPTLGILEQQITKQGERIKQAEADLERYTALGNQLSTKFDSKNDTGTSTNTSNSSNSSGSSSSVKTNGTGSKPRGGSSTGLRLVKDLVNKGYSPISASAIAGNAQYESDNFRAYEEYSPNSYGTKGAGFLQWTNAGGANRRDAFESWAKSNNLDPASYEASAGYIDAEMRGGNNWTGGQTLDGFKGISNLNEATANYMNTYLRPAKDTANLSARQSNANILYQNYLDSLK